MILDWPACDNARDLGGLPTLDGARIRPGALLRSGHHARITPATMAAIRAVGLARVVDLRWDREIAAEPSPFAGEPVYMHLPMLMDVLDYEVPEDTYGPLLDRNRKRVAAGFRAVAEAPPGAVVVHCHGGRDRTGVLVALALSVAGVAPEEIAADYALSADRLAATMRNTLTHAEHHYGGVVPYLLGSGVEQRHLDAVRTRLREPMLRR